MRPEWKMLDSRMRIGGLGFLPEFLDDEDPLSAAKQIDRAYQHGGGWRPFKGHVLNREDMTLQYPEDPPLKPLAETYLREERVIFYQHSFVLVVQPGENGAWEVARVD